MTINQPRELHPKLDVHKNPVRLTLRKAASLVRSGWLMMSSLMVGIQDTPSPSYPLWHVQLFRPGANGVQFACSKIYTVHRFFFYHYTGSFQSTEITLLTYLDMTSPVVKFTHIIWNAECSIAMKTVITPTKRLK